MARKFIGITDCEVLYEDFSALASGAILDSILEQASEWVYTSICEFNPTPSLSLPATGTSPNFFIRLATASEAVYLALSRRMLANKEGAEGYWTVFHTDAEGILEDFKSGRRRIDPEPTVGQIGIGMPTALTVGTGTEAITPNSEWIESNYGVPGCYYTEDLYPRIFTIELQTVGSNLATSTFRWKTDEDEGWYRENVKCDWNFIPLSFGVEIRFLYKYIDSYKVGQQWQISCYPERDSKSRRVAGYTTFLER
jgi:hypothetical protein